MKGEESWLERKRELTVTELIGERFSSLVISVDK
jgi:hypothetical protein